MNMNSTFTLNNDTEMPILGFGTNVLNGPSGIQTIQRALAVGYRLIDTAQSYENEEEVGQAIAESDVPREDVFITTKITDENQGFQATLDSFAVSLRKLRTDYVDLLLIHWPFTTDFTRSIETWRALIKLKEEGKARAIGVSNYTPAFIDQTIDATGVVPAVNQVEFHPFLFQKSLMQHCKAKGIQIESYCPIARAEFSDHPLLQHLSEKYRKSPVQIILRWQFAHDLIPIPRSSDPKHIKENTDIFDFSLTEEEVTKMDALDRNYRIVNPDKGPEAWKQP